MLSTFKLSGKQESGKNPCFLTVERQISAFGKQISRKIYNFRKAESIRYYGFSKAESLESAKLRPFSGSSSPTSEIYNRIDYEVSDLSKKSLLSNFPVSSLVSRELGQPSSYLHRSPEAHVQCSL